MKTLLATLALLITADQSSNADDVLARLDRYMLAYEPKLSELIADEKMTQQMSAEAIRAARRLAPASASRRLRLLSSEVAFVALPNEAGWLGFRHVKNVDGSRIKDDDASLTAALQKSGYDSAKALLQASAEHNLGLPRTTNLPNLPLEFLRVANRTRFATRFDGHERVRGTDTTRVVLVERMTPTLIRNPNGKDMPSVVRAWVDSRGRLLRAEVLTYPAAEAKRVENEIRVEFAENKSLGMLVPVQMREWFPIAADYKGSSVANYSNFRRFQTSARIVSQ